MTTRVLHGRRLAAVALTAGAMTLAACGGGGANDMPPGEAANVPSPESSGTPTASGGQPGAAAIGTETAGDLGPIIVDAEGRTLYSFEKDSDGTSTCYGACASAWPPVTTTGVQAGTGQVMQDKLGTTQRRDGSEQVTYNNHPLYYYAEDAQPGQTNGQDVEEYGAEWYALTPAGDRAESE